MHKNKSFTRASSVQSCNYFSLIKTVFIWSFADNKMLCLPSNKFENYGRLEPENNIATNQFTKNEMADIKIQKNSIMNFDKRS